MSQYLQVRDCSGWLLDCPSPTFYRFRIVHDGSEIAHVPIFTGPGLLGIAPELPMSQFFTGSGLLIMAPGLPVS